MNRKFFIFLFTMLFILTGCELDKIIDNSSVDDQTEQPVLIEGYDKKKVSNLSYQIPSLYTDVIVDSNIRKSERDIGISTVDGVSSLKAIVIGGIAPIDDYKNTNQFLYNLSKYIDGNNNEMFTFSEKKINGVYWMIGDTYIPFLNGEVEISREQVYAAVNKTEDYYYGILFAFPNNNAGKINEYEYPEFIDEVKNIFSSFVIEK